MAEDQPGAFNQDELPCELRLEDLERYPEMTGLPGYPVKNKYHEPER